MSYGPSSGVMVTEVEQPSADTVVFQLQVSVVMTPALALYVSFKLELEAVKMIMKTFHRMSLK